MKRTIIVRTMHAADPSKDCWSVREWNDGKPVAKPSPPRPAAPARAHLARPTAGGAHAQP